jgi:hypothetical protein
MRVYGLREEVQIEDDLDKAICEAGSTADDHTAERVRHRRRTSALCGTKH